jgi:hypothetical protein
MHQATIEHKINVERLAQYFPMNVVIHFLLNFQEFKGPMKGMETQIESLMNEIEMARKLQPHVATRLNDHNEAYDWLVGV